MAEFKRNSRMKRKDQEVMTKKTVTMGFLTIVIFVLTIVFGLPFLVRFSIFLGEAKNQKEGELTEKVLAPLPPRLIIPFEATNSAKIVINGLAEPGVEVELLKNDVPLEKKTVSDQGDFSFEAIDLNDGENLFSARAISEKGGSSELSKPSVVILDQEFPSLTMTNPSEDSLTVDYSDFDIIGQSEKGVSVLVNGHVAIVDDEGQFKLKVQLNSGQNEIEIKVRDLAGNETKKIVSIKYDI